MRLSVNDPFPQLMPSLYPGKLATRLQPFDSIDATWLALGTLANNKTPGINSAKYVSQPVSAASGPPPAAPGRGPGRVTSQTSAWAAGLHRNPVVMYVSQAPTDSWVPSTSYSQWLLAHCDEVCTVTDTFSTDDCPLWSGLLSPTARAATTS